MDEDHPYNNFTFYGASKIAGEHFFKSLGRRYGLNWVGLRYMNVYGPRQDYKGAYIAVMHKILDRIERGQSPLVYGDGSQQYDFVHVADVARANVLAMQADAVGHCYNVGRGIGTTIKELTELLLRLDGQRSADSVRARRIDVRDQPHRLSAAGRARLGLSLVDRPRRRDAEPHRVAAQNEDWRIIGWSERRSGRRSGVRDAESADRTRMCGIAGIVSLTRRPVEPGRIKPMCDVQAHRGPDDAGYAFFRSRRRAAGEGGYWCGFADAKFRHINEHLPVFDGDYCRDELSKSCFSLALGHRRLAIIDLTPHRPPADVQFRPPLLDHVQRRDLQFPRASPPIAGGRPRLPHPQRHGGRSSTSGRSTGRIRCRCWTGCSPLSIYDRVDNVLTLARDRFGVKPLYYAVAGDFLVFASEIKGILASGPVAAADQPAGPGRVFRLSKHAFAADAVSQTSRSCSRASFCSLRRVRRAARAAPLSCRLSALPTRRWPNRAGRSSEVAEAFREAVGQAIGQRRRSRLAISPAAWTAARSSPWPADRSRGF